MPITLTIDDPLAKQLKPYEGEVAEILDLGIREWQARNEAGYPGLNSVLEKLATLPTAEEVMALRPSAELQVRIDTLLLKNQESGMTDVEQKEWEQIQYVEHLVRLAKITAMRRLKGTKGS